ATCALQVRRECRLHGRQTSARLATRGPWQPRSFLPVRALCLHGHFYQPPREHPWLGVVEPEPSAAPAHDWNARVTAECYAPNAAAGVLDAHGRLSGLVNTYEWTGFDFGPTLLNWLAPHAPGVLH